MEGWISIHRKITEHPDYFSEPFTRMGAWIDLLILANHKDSSIRVRGIRIAIKRGQTAISQENLAIRWKWSRGKVNRYLKELETDQQITQQKNKITTCITIVNYEYYQIRNTTDSPSNDAIDSRQIDIRQTSDRHQTDTNNNDNNVYNDNKSHTHNLNLKISPRERERAHGGEDAIRTRATAILEWLGSTHPAVAGMREPLNEEQAYCLARKYCDYDIKRLLAAIDNKDRIGNKSTFSTFTSFAGHDKELRSRQKRNYRLRSYSEMLHMVTNEGYSQKDFVEETVGNERWWALKSDVVNSN